MISCLESVSKQERHEEIIRNDYNINDQYSASHPNARGGSDTKGKGTGHSGHTYWLPDCTGTLGSFNYSNFDTYSYEKAGNIDDRNARKNALTRSLYNSEYRYEERLINTAGNVMEGQYQMK